MVWTRAGTAAPDAGAWGVGRAAPLRGRYCGPGQGCRCGLAGGQGQGPPS